MPLQVFLAGSESGVTVMVQGEVVWLTVLHRALPRPVDGSRRNGGSPALLPVARGVAGVAGNVGYVECGPQGTTCRQGSHRWRSKLRCRYPH